MKVTSDILSSLKDYQAWSAGKRDFDLLDYVTCVATPDLFVGFGELFFPELVFHEGNHFLASHFQTTVYNDLVCAAKRSNCGSESHESHTHFDALSTTGRARSCCPGSRQTASVLLVDWHGRQRTGRGDLREDVRGPRGDVLPKDQVSFLGIRRLLDPASEPSKWSAPARRCGANRVDFPVPSRHTELRMLSMLSPDSQELGGRGSSCGEGCRGCGNSESCEDSRRGKGAPTRFISA